MTDKQESITSNDDIPARPSAKQVKLRQASWDGWAHSLAQKVQAVNLASWPAWLLPLFLSLLLFRISGVITEPDGSRYTNIAMNIQQGLGYVATHWDPVNRTIVFPTLLAVAFAGLGASVKTAMLVVRIFFVLDVLLVYAIGTRLGSRFIGLLASLLVLTSYILHKHFSRLIQDPVIDFWILLSLLLLLQAFQKEKRSFFVLSAVTFMVGMATEEIVALFILMPIFIWVLVGQYRNRKMLAKVILFYVPFASAIVAGYLIVLISDSNPFISVTLVSQYISWLVIRTVGASGGNGDLFSILESLATYYKNYYQRHFAEVIALTPLLSYAYLVVAGTAIFRRSLASVYLIGPLLFFIPMMPYYSTDETRQSSILYLWSMIVIAFVVYNIFSCFPRPAIWRILAATALVSIQIWVGNYAFANMVSEAIPWGSGHVKDDFIYSFDFGLKDSWQEQGWHANDIAQAGEWLREHAEEGRPIAMNWLWSHSLYFFNEARNPIYNFYRGNLITRQPVPPSLQAPLLLWTDEDGLMGFSEAQFLQSIKERQPQYIVLTNMDNHLSLYLRAHPDFFQVYPYAGPRRLQIFEVDYPVAPLAPAFFEMQVEDEVTTILEEMEQADPTQYQRHINFLQRRWGLSPDDIQRLLDEDYPVWTERDRRITHGTFADYVAEVRAAGIEALEQTIWRHQQSIDSRPASTSAWSTPELEALYEAFYGELLNGPPEQLQTMIASYEQRSADNPEDIWNFMTLAGLYAVQGSHLPAMEAYSRADRLSESVMQSTEIGNRFRAVTGAYLRQLTMGQNLAYLLERYQQELEGGTGTPMSLLELGYLYFSTDDQAAAVDILIGALEQFPESKILRVPLADTYLRMMQQLIRDGLIEEAENIYTQALDVADEIGYPQHMAQRLLPVSLPIADHYHQQGMQSQAQAVVDTYQSLNENQIRAYIDLIVLYMAWGEVDAAWETYDEAIAIDPTCEDCHQYLGKALVDNGHYDQALVFYQAYAESNPEAVWVRLALGELYLKIYDSLQP